MVVFFCLVTSAKKSIHNNVLSNHLNVWSTCDESITELGFTIIGSVIFCHGIWLNLVWERSTMYTGSRDILDGLQLSALMVWWDWLCNGRTWNDSRDYLSSQLLSIKAILPIYTAISSFSLEMFNENPPKTIHHSGSDSFGMLHACIHEINS